MKTYKCINGCDFDSCIVKCFNNNPPKNCIYNNSHVANFTLQKPDDPKAPPKAHAKNHSCAACDAIVDECTVYCEDCFRGM